MDIFINGPPINRIYNLRITHPSTDIITHANNINSCFKQMNLHPNIVPAFFIIVTDLLYLQSALLFSMDFSPQNWEPVRELVKILAEKLVSDKLLPTKHRKYLDNLKWEPNLGKEKWAFTPAKACTQCVGLLDISGNPCPTPQHLFVDDSVYAEVYEDNWVFIEQTNAAGIKAI